MWVQALSESIGPRILSSNQSYLLSFSFILYMKYGFIEAILDYLYIRLVRLELTQIEWKSRGLPLTYNRCLCLCLCLRLRLRLRLLMYLRSDLNTHEYNSEKLKFSLSTDSSTQIRAKVTWTLIITVMSSTLYLLSYSPMRTKDLHL